MLDDNRFFRYVWRVDAIIILLAGVTSVLAVVVAAAAMLFSSIGSSNNTDDSVVLDPVAAPSQSHELGYLQEIDGTPHAMLSLYVKRDQDHRFSSSGKSHDVVNYLFINGKKGSMHWLFDHNRFLIANTKMTYADSYAQRTVNAIVFTLIKADSNHNNRLDGDDQATLAVTATDGSDYTEVLTDIDSVLGIHTMDKQKVLVLYRKGTQAYHAELRVLPTIRLVSQAPLPSVSDKTNRNN